MIQKQKMDPDNQSKILVKDLNYVITCRICEGYLIDATTLVDCFHVFCRACLLRYFENTKTGCPTCNTVYKKKAQPCFRPDPQVQSLVYKLVPSLYAKELQRREDFYRRTEGLRASSSSSEDSTEREIIRNHREEMLSSQIGDRTLFLSPEDSISLSLEFYQEHLDTTDLKEERAGVKCGVVKKEKECSSDADKNNTKKISDKRKSVVATTKDVGDLKKNEEFSLQSETKDEFPAEEEDDKKDVKKERECDKRFLQCPAAVLMKHLQKFIRLKNGLASDNKVDIIYKGEVLPQNFSLMDVAYTFKWQRVKPMRFFYRIFIPMKIQRIKIVNTTSSTGCRQLQIVPVTPTTMELPKTPDRKEKTPDKKEKTPEKHEEKVVEIKHKTPEKSKQESTELKSKEVETKLLEETEDQKSCKERLFAHLQLQSRNHAESDTKKTPEKTHVKDCVFEYQEPDQEEIKEFAEKRDREWALQKKLDEKRKAEEFSVPHVSKKRKKNKHSKNEFNVHKKRKLHAEIASNEEELKLKVKITNNGHKHKHHKSSGQVNEKGHTSSVSSKEKLLQMRQVRHKHSNEDKHNSHAATVSNVHIEKEAAKLVKPEKIRNSVEKTKKENGEESKIIPATPKMDDIKKLKIKMTEPSSVVTELAVLPKQHSDNTISTSPKVGALLEPPTSSKTVEFATVKSPIVESREWGKKVPAERNEKNDKQAQTTFLKTFHAYAEKYHKNEKIEQTKKENAKIKQMNLNKIHHQFNKTETNTNKINNINKSFAKATTIHQVCSSMVQKMPEKIEKKVSFATNTNTDHQKPSKVVTMTPHYPPGFTVSKIEQGVKRKSSEDNDQVQDKRPSLEITLITPPKTSPVQQSPNSSSIRASTDPKPPAVKRPPPATIPLERIKKSVNLKSGISIIPKMSSSDNNVGPLDLSNPNKSPETPPKTPPRLEATTNGFSITSNRQINNSTVPVRSGDTKTNISLSNLQMLSKVATEHSTLNNKTPTNNSPKPRPQMPNLQTLKIPTMLNNTAAGQMKAANLQKMPKLNEIHKFRPSNPQVRNIRPNQNQNIRNIPNPSLLIRQQNQNRLNSQISITNTASENGVTITSTRPTPTTTATVSTTTPSPAAVSPVQKETLTSSSAPASSSCSASSSTSTTATSISAVKSMIESSSKVVQEKKELTA